MTGIGTLQNQFAITDNLRYDGVVANYLDDLREIVREDPRTQRAIARASGLTEAKVSLFLAGAGVSHDNVERLAKAVGYEVIVRRRKRGNR